MINPMAFFGGGGVGGKKCYFRKNKGFSTLIYLIDNKCIKRGTQHQKMFHTEVFRPTIIF